MENQIFNIINDMAGVLNGAQLKRLQEVLIFRLAQGKEETIPVSNKEYMDMFLTAKRIEGCSERTIAYYGMTIAGLLAYTDIPLRCMTTELLREYLQAYQQRNSCSKVTVDNVRRNLSSFFSWLEEEDYILKSPIRRIHKIRTKKPVKEVISDENMELLRDNCKEIRDLAMIDLLYSTGMRVGELVRLNIEDLNLEERECIVYGKGDKERKVYFDARTKLHLQDYIASRKDSNPALFVSLDAPYDRLQISGVEIRLRTLGRRLHLNKIHPHKFRRTLLTDASARGMPLQELQVYAGHAKPETTMIYVTVRADEVKASFRRLVA